MDNSHSKVLAIIALISFLFSVMPKSVWSADTPLPTILLVYDVHTGNPEELLSNYTQILDALGYKYTVWDVKNPGDSGPSYNDMKNYDIIIWFTGDDGASVALTSTDIQNLKEYLDSGGKLFLSGEHIVESIAQKNETFLEDYLHAFLCNPAKDYGSIYGVNNSFVGDDFYDMGYNLENNHSIVLNSVQPRSIIFFKDAIRLLGDYYVYINNIWNGSYAFYYYNVSLDPIHPFHDGSISSTEYVCLDFNTNSNRCPRGKVRYWNVYRCQRGSESFYITSMSEDDIIHGFNSIAYDNGTNSYKVVLFGFEWGKISNYYLKLESMRRIIGFLMEPRAINVGLSTDITCDPLDSYCERKYYPVLIGTCELRKDPYYWIYLNGTWHPDDGLLSNVKNAEFCINTSSHYCENAQLGYAYGQAQYVSDYLRYSYVYRDFAGTINVSNLSEGTYNIGVRCQDSENDWGGFANVTLVVDKTPPLTPYVRAAEKFVNSEIASFKLYYRYRVSSTEVFEIDPSNLPDYVSYSCDNSSWSYWIGWNVLPNESENNGDNLYKKINVDITLYGCNTTDGNRTVYFRFKDKAGNIAYNLSGKPNYDWVVLDTRPPWFEITPNADNWVNPNTPFVVNVFDDWAANNTVSYSVISTTDYSVLRKDFASNDTEFKPFENLSDGEYILRIITQDIAGNSNVTDLTYYLDTLPPALEKISPSNGSIIPSETKFELNWTDPCSWKDVSGNCLRSGADDVAILQLGNGTNLSIKNNVPFTLKFGTGGWHNLTVYLRDGAGNINITTLRYFVDTSLPVITAIQPPNNSIITLKNQINISAVDMPPELNAGMNETGIFNNGNGTNTTFIIGVPFNPGWNASDEGEVWMDIWVSDVFNNTNHSRLHYYLDVNPPNTTDNYTEYVQKNGWKWFNDNVAISLNCTDAVSGCNVTYYCLATSSDCTPSTTYNDNSPIITQCPEGEACTYYLRYYSIDNAGHREDVKGSAYNISIDRAPPQINVISPQNDSIQSGIVKIQISILDEGSGADKAYYYIFNTTGSLVDSGELNASNGYTAFWNSSSVNGTHYIIINATDRVGNTGETNVTVYIDNSYPSAIIEKPLPGSYLNTTLVQIYLVGNKTGVNLTSCEYEILNNAGQIIYTKINNSVNASACDFNETVNLSRYGDGTYTIRFNVSVNTLTTTTTSHFVIDTSPPSVRINAPANNSIVSGTINITYTAGDVNPAFCEMLYKSNSTSGWIDADEDLNYGTYQNVTFNTLLRCEDSSAPECGIKIVCTDKAGNTNDTEIYLQVDNSPPTIELIAPSEYSWHSKSFNITLNITDPHTNVSECYYSVQNGPATPFDCSGIRIHLPDNCSYEGYGSCSVNVSAKNGANLTSSKILRFSIDYTPPSVVSVVPPNGSVILNTTNISLAWKDNFYIYGTTNNTGIVQLENRTNISIENGVEFSPSFSGDGWHEINVWVFDIAGNVKPISLKYYVDEKPPDILNITITPSKDPTYNEVRVFPQDYVFVDVWLNDTKGVSAATLNVTLPNGSVEVVGGYLLKGTVNLGEWRFTIVPDQLGVYNITALRAVDKFGHENIAPLNMTFRVVDAKLSVKINHTSSTDYWTVVPFQINFTFNKTIENSELSVLVPPLTCNDLGSGGITVNPYYSVINFSTATPACSVARINNTANLTSGWYLNITNATVACTITGYLIAKKIASEDLSTIWQACFREREYNDSTTIRSPNLKVWVNTSTGGVSFSQREPFEIILNLTNVRDVNHTGSAVNLTAELILPEGYEYSNITLWGTPAVRSIGTLGSGESTDVLWNLSVGKVGNYTFRVVVKENGTLIKEENINITINDTTPPEILYYYLENNRNTFYASLPVNFYAWILDNTGVKSSSIYLRTPDGTIKIINGTDFDNNGEWKFAITNTTQEGHYTILSIYAEDKYGNSVNKTVNLTFEVLRMNIDVIAPATGKIGVPLNISVQVKNNITEILGVDAAIIKPSGYEDVDYLRLCGTDNGFFVYCGTYDNITQSGNYTINVTVKDKIASFTNHSKFFVDYGTGRIVYAESEGNTVRLPSTVIYHLMEWRVLIEGGDLHNVTLNITISNTSVVALSPGENQTKTFDYIPYEGNENGFMVGWNITIKSNGSTLINVTLNTSKNFNYSVINLTVIPEDVQPPEIEEVRITPHTTNLMSPVRIEAKVKDNTIVDDVKAEISIPNGTVMNLSLNRINASWFGIDYSAISIPGEYKVRIFATDVGGNSNVSQSFAFNATDIYPWFTASPLFLKYNKGDSIKVRLELKDVNNKSVSGFKLHAIINMSGIKVIHITKNVFGSEAYIYTIQPQDPPTDQGPPVLNYTITLWAEKNGNTVANNVSFQIKVYREFIIKVLEPSENEKYSAYIPVVIKVLNIRGQPVNWISGGEAWCVDGCANPFTRGPYTILTSTGIDGVYANLQAFSPFVGVKKAKMKVYAGDVNRNEKEVYTTAIITQGVVPKASVSGGGGGNSRMMGGIFPNLTVLPIKIEEFHLKLLEDTVEVQQGKNASVAIILSNPNPIEMVLLGSVKIDKSAKGINVSLPMIVHLMPKEEKTILMGIEVPLYIPSGEYVVVITYTYQNVSKSQPIRIKVVENDEIKKLEALISQYHKLLHYLEGINQTGRFQGELNEIEKLIEKAHSECILENDEECLKGVNEDIAEKIDSIESRIFMAKLRLFLYEYKKALIYGLIGAVCLLILLELYILPLISISKRLNKANQKLNTLIETRRNIQKQYFRREIDEPTFRTMVSEIQEKVLKERAEIKQLEKYRQLLLHGKILTYRRAIKEQVRKDKEKKKEIEKHPVSSNRKKIKIPFTIYKLKMLTTAIRLPSIGKKEDKNKKEESQVSIEDIEKRLKTIRNKLEKVKERWSKE